MNRLRDYTRLIRIYGGKMYGGLLQSEETGLTPVELSEYKDKLVGFVPSIDIDARVAGGIITAFNPTENALLKTELAKNKTTAFTTIANLETIYLDRTGLSGNVTAVLDAWVDVKYGWAAIFGASDFVASQNWILVKLVEVLNKLNTKAPSTRKLPPPGTRVGPPRSSPISQFEDDLIKWLKNEPPSSAIPIDTRFDTDWHTIDVQLLEAYNALTDNTKVRTLINKLLTRFQASAPGHEEFGMQIGLLHGYM